MLEEIHVRDLALIEEAWLEFGPGLTVLTGETGAGKTVLLGALKLLMGDRADSASVRTGAREALVEGRFSACDEEFLVKRRVGSDGRSRCTIDSEMSTVGTLAAKAGPLIDLHGQHEHQALLSPSTHAGYLDRWIGTAAADALAAYRDALGAYREAHKERDRVEALVADAERNRDQLTYILSEIERIDPRPGEDDDIETRLPALQHAERLSEAAGIAAAALKGDAGAGDSIAAASEALARVAGIDAKLDALAQQVAEVQVAADELGSAARAYRDAVEHDSGELERLLARAAAISGLKKKFGPTLDEVLEVSRSTRESLSVAEASDEARMKSEKALTEAEDSLRAAAEALAVIREKEAPSFSAALSEAAADLAMSGATFEVRFEQLQFQNWMQEGPHRLEFLYSAVPGQTLRPLSKIASGGEISRVMLALKSVLGSADTVETLIFDEIDAGIGGATAQAVGRRLAALARGRQVIAVTHLAQVAVHAAHHLVVSRESDGEDAATTVTAVSGEERVAEIARMLSGEGSDASLQHARELLSAGVSDD